MTSNKLYRMQTSNPQIGAFVRKWWRVCRETATTNNEKIAPVLLLSARSTTGKAIRNKVLSSGIPAIGISSTQSTKRKYETYAKTSRKNSPKDVCAAPPLAVWTVKSSKSYIYCCSCSLYSLVRLLTIQCMYGHADMMLGEPCRNVPGWLQSSMAI